jgi:tRNA-dihydrouridine synthase B
MPLPWSKPVPLMLAPMQGLTNRGLRRVYGQIVQPDVLFTEFVRVRPGAPQPVAASDFVEATASVPGIPLVVQVIGSADEGVVEAVTELVAAGVQHINVNMGCPWGRMTSVLAGGGMFRAPETVAPMLHALRELVPGSLSVKTRTGIDDERQIFDVLPAFADAGIDFLAVHSRTVAQKYKGRANHALTAEIVRSINVPVIANGDVCTVADAREVLAHTGAAGLMLGRGALADPHLFRRIRGTAPAEPTSEQRQAELAALWHALLDDYVELFAGDAQVLAKFSSLTRHVNDPSLKRWLKGLKKAKTVAQLRSALV